MERKNYLVEKLSNGEKRYLEKVVLNAKRKFIRDNYDYLNTPCIDLYECDIEDIEGATVLEAVILKCESEIKSAIEFEKTISDERLYNIVKALSLKEKMVLFYLYKEKKSVKQIIAEMKIDKSTFYRIKARALDKIGKYLLGGNENV